MIEFLLMVASIVLPLIGLVLLGLLFSGIGLILAIVINYFTGTITKIIKYIEDSFK